MEALGAVFMAEAYAGCPYLLQNGAEGKYGPNTCIGGCWEEPSCVTMEPEGGWQVSVREDLDVVAELARADAREARGRHGDVKHARDVMRWATRRVIGGG